MEMAERVQRRFESLVPADGAGVGMVVGVHADGEDHVVAVGGVDTRAILEIGSVTKTFTALLLAEMCNRDEVSLGDPLSRHLPDGVRGPTRDGREITLLEVATHTAGLPRLPPGLGDAVTDPGNPYAGFTLDDLWRSVSAVQLEGSDAVYSNFGFGLLGELLALAAGRPYAELVRERICRPLGMASTMVHLDAELRSRRAPGHDASGNPVSHWDIPALGGAGALQSCGSDMLVYLRAHLEPSSSPLRDAIEQSVVPRVTRPDGHRVGLGWHITKLPSGRTVVWHNGGTGGFGAFAGFHPESQTAVTALANFTHSGELDTRSVVLLDDLAAREIIG